MDTTMETDYDTGMWTGVRIFRLIGSEDWGKLPHVVDFRAYCFQALKINNSNKCHKRKKIPTAIIIQS